MSIETMRDEFPHVSPVTRTCAQRVTGGGCQICDANELGTWRWDLVTDEISGSEQTRRTLGLGQQPESRETFLARIGAADRDGVRNLLERAAWDHAPFDVHFGVVMAGEPRTLHMQAYPDFEAGDEEACFFGTVEDITARLQAADALLELSLAVEQSRDYVCIANAAGTIEYVNPAWREKAARERNLAGLPVAVLLGDPQIYAEGRAEVDRNGMFKRTIQKTNGSAHYEEITMWPVRDVHGNVARLVILSSDVTDRKHTEEANAKMQAALRKASSEWRQTVDAVDTAIILFDPPATIRRMNLAARNLLGRCQYDLVGCNIASAALPQPWGVALALVQKAAATGLSCSAQAHDEAKGRTWDVVANVSLSEEVRDVVIVIRDITDTLTMQESLRRSEMMAAMGNLVAGVAHEVKNPLFGMTATLDAMDLKFRASADALRYTAMIRREVERVQTVMRDLLDYGRPTSPEFQATMLGAVIASAVKLCRSDSKSAQVTVLNAVPSAFGPCRVDSTRLERVFRNLIDNAVRHSSAGQAVAITARETSMGDRDAFEVEIRDQGPGIADEDLPNIFEPFFTRRTGGTGLGLSIVRRIVEEHDGKVTVENSKEGGAIFRVVVPLQGA